MSSIARVPRRSYLFVYVVLMLLLAATVGAAFLPLGPFHGLISVGIAITKAVLVLLFFMHLRHSPGRTVFFVSGGFLVFLILVGLVAVDYWTRVNGLPGMH
jgi:cytochrome c oxidase subunit IV